MAARNFYFEEIEIPSFPEIIWFSQYPVENMDGQSYIHFAVIVQPQSYLILCDPMNCSTPGFSVLTISWSLLTLMSLESVMPSNHLILCHPLLLLPSVFPNNRGFSSELALHIRWPKYWSFSISPSNENPGLISFRTNWFDLAVQGTLKSLLQYRSSKTSIFGP